MKYIRRHREKVKQIYMIWCLQNYQKIGKSKTVRNIVLISILMLFGININNSNTMEFFKFADEILRLFFFLDKQRLIFRM